MCIEVRFNVYAFCTETDIHGFIQRHSLSDINIVIIKSFATFNDIYCQQLKRVHLQSEILLKWMAKMFYSQFAMFVYDHDDHKLWNTARWQEPAFHKHFKLQISQWSTFDHRVEMLQHWAQWNINSLMVKYVQTWNWILSQKQFSWWIASFQIPIISTMREGLFVIYIEWSFCILSNILTIPYDFLVNFSDKLV